MGIRGGASLKRGLYKPIKDSLSRSWRNMINFRVEAETYQPTMLMLKKMIEWLNGNVDAQILTNKQTSGASNGDVFIFKQTASTNLGLDFELMFNADKRSIKAILEGALNYADAETLIDAADSASPYTFTGVNITGAGENELFFRKPAFVQFEFPAAATVLYRDEIVERSYSIKTKSKKSVETNMSIVDYLSYEIMMKFRNASAAKQVEIMAKDNAPSIYIRENNAASDGSEWDAFWFAAGALTLDDEFEVNDEDRHQTLKFTGDVFLYNHVFTFSEVKGSPLTDGTDGGTMFIGTREDLDP
jgi:hypothetical protein